MTDRLTAVLDRFVADQRSAVAPLADVRSRARQRRRRRVSVTSTAALVTALLIGGGVWAVQANREPGILVVADGEVRLNDWVTLTWLPDDVVSVQFDGTSRQDAMETFGYWQGHYSLRRGIDDPIVFHIALNDPFDVDAEKAMTPRAVIEGDRVRFSIEDGRWSISTRIGPATVQVIGDEPDVLHRLLDAMVVDEPTVDVPGKPITLASGKNDGVPWEVRVTTPTTPISAENLEPNGTCLSVRTYTSAIACVRGRDDGIAPSWMNAPWDHGTEVGPLWFLYTETPAASFEYVLPDGGTTSVAARSAAPAPGAFAVVDLGTPGQMTGARALAADGAVLQEQDPGFSLP